MIKGLFSVDVLWNKGQYSAEVSQIWCNCEIDVQIYWYTHIYYHRSISNIMFIKYELNLHLEAYSAF